MFRQYFTGLCAFARKYIHDFDASKEIVHDVFINFWNKRETIDPNKSVKSYLFTSVHNRCLNYIRDRKKFDDDATERELMDYRSGNDAAEMLMGKELETRIENALETLPEKCREVFKMNRFEGLKYKEIAEILNISIKTVETQMSKGLKLMREALADYLV